jgi:hypothetical protein
MSARTARRFRVQTGANAKTNASEASLAVGWDPDGFAGWAGRSRDLPLSEAKSIQTAEERREVELLELRQVAANRLAREPLLELGQEEVLARAHHVVQ